MQPRRAGAALDSGGAGGAEDKLENALLYIYIYIHVYVYIGSQVFGQNRYGELIGEFFLEGGEEEKVMGGKGENNNNNTYKDKEGESD